MPFAEAPGIRTFPDCARPPGAYLNTGAIAVEGTANKHLPRPVGLILCLATCALVGVCGGGSAPPTNANGVSRTLPVDITVNH